MDANLNQITNTPILEGEQIGSYINRLIGAETPLDKTDADLFEETYGRDNIILMPKPYFTDLKLKATRRTHTGGIKFEIDTPAPGVEFITFDDAANEYENMFHENGVLKTDPYRVHALLDRQFSLEMGSFVHDKKNNRDLITLVNTTSNRYRVTIMIDPKVVLNFFRVFES